MRIYKSAVTVDCADAVAVAIGAERGIVFSGTDRLTRGFDMRLDGLGMYACKAGIARAANFIAGDSVAREQSSEQPGCRTVHWVAQESELCVAQARPIDQFFDGVQIGCSRFEWLDQFFARRKRWSAFALDLGKFAFNLRDDGRQSAAAITRFVLDAVPGIGIVARGDDNASGGVALADQQGNRGCGAGFVG